ncbi:threonine dehydratase [Streptomyces sp. ADI96-02]|uniref:hypothetical protein n=1 Tax=unclassified Streptomyces TaxID=2593676 RepID=UPI000FAA4B99|nr:hypothetical protein [Streptomyces sp. ADI96-02]RPK64654.1 threonine dehydratase [Streptomyces sp. ADI96-02]
MTDTKLSRREVYLFAERLKGRVVETPLPASADFSHRMGRPVLVKAEIMQHSGSFKYRGR